jgi:hypothetical protein
MTDGHLGKCIDCAKQDVKDRYQSPKGKLKITKYEKQRSKDPHRKAKCLVYQKTRRHKHVGKNKARNKVSKLIASGLLKRKSCIICGNSKSEAHHPDYRSPLKIIWLCFKHHRELHGQQIN